MSRKVLTICEIDEEVAQKLDDNYSPGDYVQREFERMKQSGVTLRDWLVSDEDDVERWARYIDYLIEWSFEHSSEYDEGMTPVCYDEWCDNEDSSIVDDNEHHNEYVYIITHHWCVIGEPVQNSVLGVFTNYNSAREQFLKEKIKETTYAIKNGWTVFTDNETNYDIGKKGFYNDNHSEISIVRMRVQK